MVDGDDHPLHMEWYFPDGEGGSYEGSFSEQGGLYHGSACKIRVIWNIFHSDRIKDGVLFWLVY